MSNSARFISSRRTPAAQIKEAWALGGALSYQSGYFLDHFSAGAVLYTSQPLYAPDDRDGTLLLAPGQEGYTVLGQAYGRVKVVEDNFINLYRYEYNTPFINKNDFRMTPNTFEGYTFTGAVGDKDGGSRANYGFGYIDKIKTRNDSTFQSMSRAAGAQVDRGVFPVGLNYSYRGFQVGAINYYSQDIINIAYGETKYTWKVTDLLGLLFAGQFADQRSVGGKPSHRVRLSRDPVRNHDECELSKRDSDPWLHEYRGRSQHAEPLEQLPGLHHRASEEFQPGRGAGVHGQRVI